MAAKRRVKVKFLEPQLTPGEQKNHHCLSKKHGGEASCKSYCTMFEAPPIFRSVNLLCSGGGFWPPCPDLSTCLQTVWRMTWVRRAKDKIDQDPDVIDLVE